MSHSEKCFKGALFAVASWGGHSSKLEFSMSDALASFRRLQTVLPKHPIVKGATPGAGLKASQLTDLPKTPVKDPATPPAPVTKGRKLRERYQDHY